MRGPRASMHHEELGQEGLGEVALRVQGVYEPG